MRTEYYFTLYDVTNVTVALDQDDIGHKILFHSIDGTEEFRISGDLYELMRLELGGYCKNIKKGSGGNG